MKSGVLSWKPAVLIGCMGFWLLTERTEAQEQPGLEVIEELAQSRAWQGLLHFDRGGRFGRRRSAVTSGGFFLAEGGSHDPQLELQATIEALREEPDGTVHAQCRFPARALWLEEVGIHRFRTDVACEEWKDWEVRHSSSDLGLLFATGYLGNPASFFGHLLFHLSEPPGAETAAAALLETSYNFGADVPNDEGMVSYVLKGLFGGFEAQFSNAQFFRNAWIYSERQMRELWYYRLQLPDFERRLLVAHLYELSDFRFDYLFLTENCASRIARTLEIVSDGPIVPGNALWVSPEAVVRAVTLATVNGAPVFGGVEHRPSRRAVTESLYLDLPPNGQTAVPAIWPQVGRLDLDAEEYRKLSLDDRARVIQVALSHVRSLSAAVEDAELSRIEQDLLRERLRLPLGRSMTEYAPGTPIHKARPGARLGVGALQSTVHGLGSRVNVRVMQYDLLDSDDARQPNATLELFRLEADYYHGDLAVAAFQVFNVLSLYVDPVPLPLTRSSAWRVAAGAERVDENCRSCRDGYLTALSGRSFAIGIGTAYVMGGATLRTTRFQTGWFALAAEGGLVSIIGEPLRVVMSARVEDALHGQQGRRHAFSAESRLGLTDRLDVRAGWRRHSDDSQSGLFVEAGWYR